MIDSNRGRQQMTGVDHLQPFSIAVIAPPDGLLPGANQPLNINASDCLIVSCVLCDGISRPICAELLMPVRSAVR